MELAINLQAYQMKNKLFIAFSGIILIGLLSNMIFAFLIYKDFLAYSDSLREDQLGWVKASIETGYSHGRWNRQVLIDALHWGLMLGFYIKIYDGNGKELISSEDILSYLHPAMKKRMEETIDLKRFHGKERTFELYGSEEHGTTADGPVIGKLTVRSLSPWGVARLKEEAFKKKLVFFLGGSIAFVTIASFLIAYLLSTLISRPFIKLREVTERLRDGDLSIRANIKGGDEVASLADSFNRMAERLQKEDELRKHLISQLTHELRTPLTIISTSIAALKDRLIEPDRAIKNIEPEIERLQRLIEGMEEITRAELSLFTTVKPANIDLFEFIKNTTKSFEQEFERKGLYLKIDGEPIQLKTDQEKLAIIIRNLLQNSLRFTERGGVTIFIKREKSGAMVSISDTGRGIEPSRLPFIFKRFYKDEKSPGLGIGLSIVDGLLKLLGGSIEVESIPQKGTTFRIFIGDMV